MKTLLILVSAIYLSGCAYNQKASAPVIDTKAMPVSQAASYPRDVQECRDIQEKSMRVSFLEAFGSSDVRADERRREEKASAIVRECLKGRGYSVLY